MTRTKNKLVYGYGINDADHPVYENGKPIKSYQIWKDMIRRTHEHEYHVKYPTYSNSTVYPDWLYYSNFKKWFDSHYVEGWDLDKDLLDPSNKEYSPSKCIFVPHRINLLVVDRGRSRGEWPIGVSYDKLTKKFRAQISDAGKYSYLGSFSTPEAAHLAWLKAKREIVLELKPELDAIHPDLYEAIMSRYPLPEAVNDGLYFLEAA